MSTSSTIRPGLDQQRRTTAALATVAGRVGAIFVAALGVVHAVVNTIGFAELGFEPWRDYLIFGVGLSLLAFLLAFGAWRIADSVRPRWVIMILVGLGGLLLVLQLIGIAVTDPALLLRPLGPGLWSLIGGPALVLEIIGLTVRWIGSRPDRRAADLMK